MPHLYAIYTHGNNDAKITKDIIHSRAYRMKGGVLTYKPFPFVAPKNRFLIKSLHFPGFFSGELSPLFLHVALNVTPVLKQKSIRVTYVQVAT